MPAAALMALVLGRPAVDVVTWVPADPLREAMRGYHPARLLAEQLALRWDVPSRPLLRAPLWRRPQRGLTRAERRANVREALTPPGAGARPAGPIDDAATTRAPPTPPAPGPRRGRAGAGG